MTIDGKIASRGHCVLSWGNDTSGDLGAARGARTCVDGGVVLEDAALHDRLVDGPDQSQRALVSTEDAVCQNTGILQV